MGASISIDSIRSAGPTSKQRPAGDCSPLLRGSWRCMSYEDVIRVAEAKIDPARLARIMGELAVKPGQTIAVIEFLKPGIDELCSILPPGLATAILKLAHRYPALGRLHFAMAVNSRSISGYLHFAALAKLR